uniref:Uncharacterized protein n=1 Tax=Cyclophora tenuis TaxID=216820 RepID=A0A7S1GKN4_CYCTE|mmetsp:Transcript_23704/g.40211  ORF Transcript_23704/g.40211 Transcript_23704/m.40211 type:complete len:186 (+) Transcript_23704:175-732(+)
METQWKFATPPPQVEDVQNDRHSQRRSQTIPLPSHHIPKTRSEHQLSEDMAAAEWRDLCMFYRVVHGIKERQTANSQLPSLRHPPAMTTCQEDETFTNMDYSRNVDRYRADTVTPNPPLSIEGSPQTQDMFFGGFLGDKPSATPELSGAHDEWSISGYEGTMTPPRVPIVETEKDEDDGIFNMDL